MFNNLVTVRHEDAYQYYDYMVKKYPDGRVEIKEYSRSLCRLKPGLAPREGPPSLLGCEHRENLSESKKTSDCPGFKVHRRDNLARSFGQLLDYIDFNPIWTSFLTLTFKDNVTDLTIANKEFNKFTKKVKRAYPEFLYVGVPEFQQRGAVHYHLLTNIPINSDIIPKRPPKKTYNTNKNKWYHIEYYDIKYWIQGRSSAFDVVNEVDEHFKLGAYMGGYFFKDMDERLFNRKKILKSQGLKGPKISRYSKNDEEFIKLQEKLYKEYNKPKIKGVISQSRYAPNILIFKYDLK